jgi:hypothetical protein
MQEGSDAILIQDAFGRAEMVVTNAPLGADRVGAYGTEPRPGNATGGPCLDFMMRSSGPSMPGSTSPGDAVKAPGHRVLRIRGLANWGSWVTSARCPHQLGGSRWRTAQSRHAHVLQSRIGCCRRRWPRSVRRSYI